MCDCAFLSKVKGVLLPLACKGATKKNLRILSQDFVILLMYQAVRSSLEKLQNTAIEGSTSSQSSISRGGKISLLSLSSLFSNRPLNSSKVMLRDSSGTIYCLQSMTSRMVLYILKHLCAQFQRGNSCLKLLGGSQSLLLFSIAFQSIIRLNLKYKEQEIWVFPKNYPIETAKRWPFFKAKYQHTFSKRSAQFIESLQSEYNSYQQKMDHQCHSEPVSPYLTYTYICRKSVEEEETSQRSKLSRLSLLNSSELSYRINQLKPKSKINIKKKVSDCSTLAHTKKKEEVVAEHLLSKINLEFTPTRHAQKVITESIEYHTIKPAFNWTRLNIFCGFNGAKLGEQGCLCGQPCPWKQEWTKFKTKNDRSVFRKLLIEKPKAEDVVQIEKDIDRTHSECPTFSSNEHFKGMLRSILLAYSIYDHEMGYIQGMNMIAGILLYHIKNAEETFWAFVDLMEVKQLRTVYLDGFAHLKIHCNNIIELLQAKVNDLYQHMVNLDIYPQTFINGWLLSLMSNYIPIEYMHHVIGQFKKNGFTFMYKLILSYMLFLKERLILCEDQSQFLFAVSLKCSRELGLQWEQVIESSNKLIL